jgi:uncharacterized repeat protein (TIGR04042 family)
MPEMRFCVLWPDGSREICYSPSRVVQDYFVAGSSYTLVDFLERSRAALTAAAERVRQIYGAPCSRALGQLAAIESKSRAFAEGPEAHVTVEAFVAADAQQD